MTFTFDVFLRTISVAKFPDHFYQLSGDDNRGFSQEYEVHEKSNLYFVLPLPLLPNFAEDCISACVLLCYGFLFSYLFPIVLCLICMPCHVSTVMQSLISVGTEQTRKEAVLPENKARNRFNNVLPCKPIARLCYHKQQRLVK